MFDGCLNFCLTIFFTISGKEIGWKKKYQKIPLQVLTSQKIPALEMEKEKLDKTGCEPDPKKKDPKNLNPFEMIFQSALVIQTLFLSLYGPSLDNINPNFTKKIYQLSHISQMKSSEARSSDDSER